MANSLVKIAGFVLIYAIASFYGLLVSVFLLFKLCQLRGKLFKKTQRKQVPECLQDASFGNHHYVTTKSGHKFHYVAKGDTDKPLMLCLHGFPEFWFSWRFQLKEFSNDYHVVAFDMRGYGDSYSPTGAINYVAQFLVQDIKEVVDALGYSSCVLLGHDWGGVSAWSFAMMYPDIVDKLVIMNAPHPLVWRKKKVFLSRKQFFMSWYVYFDCLPYLPEIFFSFNDNCLFDEIHTGTAWTDEVKDAFKYMFTKPGAWTPPINYYRAAMLYAGNVSWPKKAKKVISLPTLVVWGNNDKYIDKSLLNYLDEYVENLTVKIVEGAGHWVQQEKPDVVNKYVRQFLEVN